jgi:hypothetical protein
MSALCVCEMGVEAVVIVTAASASALFVCGMGAFFRHKFGHKFGHKASQERNGFTAIYWIMLHLLVLTGRGFASYHPTHYLQSFP